MSRLTDSLNAYGADTVATMERFLQDEELYINCLQTFSQDSGFDDLLIALKNHNFHDAFDFAHMLKGVAGNLGLTPLYSALCVLVKALRAQDYSNVMQQYQNICNEKSKIKTMLLP